MTGGFPYAGELEGFTPLWASEIEAAPISITKRHFPDMAHVGDITELDGRVLEPVHAIAFGSPCQDLSVAGRREGLEGAQSGLFMEAIRVVKEMRSATNGVYPAYVIWENVPGAFSSNDGEDFRKVITEIARVPDPGVSIPRPSGRAGDTWFSAGALVGDGYSLAWRVLDAQYWGVPQRRRRIFLVADLGSRRAGEILFNENRLHRDSQEGKEKGERPPADAERSPSETGQLFLEPPAYCIQGNTINRTEASGAMGKGVNEEVSFTLDTSGKHAVAYPINDKATRYRGGGGGRDDGAGNGFGIGGDGDPMPTLDTASRHAVALGSGKPVTGTLLANCGTKQWLGNQEAFSGDYFPIADSIIRRLTPVECERLQGFPDGWTATGHDGKPISDTARYKALGNSVAIPCVRFVLSGIAEILKEGEQ